MTSGKTKQSLRTLANILQTSKGDCKIKFVLTTDDTIIHVSIQNLKKSFDCKITHQQNIIPSEVLSSCCHSYCQQFPSILDPITADLQALILILDQCDEPTFSEQPFITAGWTKPSIYQVVYG